MSVILLTKKIPHQLRLIVHPHYLQSFVTSFQWWSPHFWTINRTETLWSIGVPCMSLTLDHLSQGKDVWSWVVVQAPDAETEKKKKDKLLHPWRLTAGTYSWRFGRSFSFLNGWLVGSVLIFQGVETSLNETFWREFIRILLVFCLLCRKKPFFPRYVWQVVMDMFLHLH